MQITEQQLEEAHRRHSANHEAEILASELCGCFYCIKTYPPQAISTWIDDTIDGEDGRTALCPKCGIDSVIGTSSGFPVSEDFLKAMNRRWFGA